MPLQRLGPHGLTQHEHMKYYQDRVAPILEELSLDVMLEQPSAPVPCMIKWLYGNAKTSLPNSDDAAVKTSLNAEVSALQADIAALEAQIAKKEAALVPGALDEEDQLKMAGKDALLAAFPDEEDSEPSSKQQQAMMTSQTYSLGSFDEEDFEPEDEDEDEDAPSKATPAKRGLQFDDNAEELEAASAAADGPIHSARDRTQTGFVVKDDLPSETVGLQFDDNAEQLDAASSATDGLARSARERTQTGFARQDDLSSETGGVQFNDTAEQFDAASSATDGAARPARERVQTGFARQEDDTPDEFDEAAGNEEDEDDEPCRGGRSLLNLDTDGASLNEDTPEALVSEPLADPTEANERLRAPRPTAVNQTHEDISGELGGELFAALASIPDGEEEAAR